LHHKKEENETIFPKKRLFVQITTNNES